MNHGKAWRDQIKPFNFFLVGFSAKRENGPPVKPIMPYSKDPQVTVFAPFINYDTGEIMEGIEYFKPLSITLAQYINHPESKYRGNRGQLHRRHIQSDGIIHIGKEANKIDEQPLQVTNPQIFPSKDEIMRKILAIPWQDAEKYGVHRTTLWRIQEQIRKNGDVKLNSKLVKNLLKYIS
jgi:hypothetical protein